MMQKYTREPHPPFVSGGMGTWGEGGRHGKTLPSMP